MVTRQNSSGRHTTTRVYMASIRNSHSQEHTHTHARAHAALTDRTEQSRPQLHGAPASVAHSPRRVIAGPQNKSPCLLPRALGASTSLGACLGQSPCTGQTQRKHQTACQFDATTNAAVPGPAVGIYPGPGAAQSFPPQNHTRQFQPRALWAAEDGAAGLPQPLGRSSGS